MARKCFISFKTENSEYKESIQKMDINMIDKSLDDPINSDNEDYIMRKIREDYLQDSSVTIFLIGQKSGENLGWEEQKFIKRELQASLYDAPCNRKSGILGIVLPSMYDKIYTGQYPCSSCGGSHNGVAVNNNTVISEFSYNYYIPQNNKCAWSEDDRYCVLVKWDDFIKNSEDYIEKAFEKRNAAISNNTRVRP